MRSEAVGIGGSRGALGAQPVTMLSNIATVNAGFRSPRRGVAHAARPTTGDTMADLKKAFEQAVADSKGLPEKPDNATLLKIYALYKQATVGDVDGKRPGFTDMVGRAKWDAWNELKGKAADSAMQEYVDLIESLK
jgi:acyl-CoA-binding protein